MAKKRKPLKTCAFSGFCFFKIRQKTLNNAEKRLT